MMSAAEMLREQRERVRRHECMICGVSRDRCNCGEYDQLEENRVYQDDRPERRYE